MFHPANINDVTSPEWNAIQLRKAAMVSVTMGYDRPNPFILADHGWSDDKLLGERRVAEAIILWNTARGRPAGTLRSILGYN